MVEVYFYVSVQQVDNAVECGMKLSEWYSREIEIEGERKKCISALLNPRDDHERYMSQDYRCLKLEVQSKYCFAADSLLYQPGLVYPEVMEMYRHSIVPIGKYTFGDYRLPECLVTSTVTGENISVLGRGGLDTPVLYNNSQELYLNNILASFREADDNFDDSLLYHFFKKLHIDGRVNCVEDSTNGLAVFQDRGNDRTYTLKIPDMGRYQGNYK